MKCCSDPCLAPQLTAAVQVCAVCSQSLSAIVRGEHPYAPNTLQLKGKGSNLQVKQPLTKRNIHPKKENKVHPKDNRNTHVKVSVLLQCRPEFPKQAKLGTRPALGRALPTLLTAFDVRFWPDGR